MKRTAPAIVLILLMACSREEVPVTLSLELSAPTATTVTTIFGRAHLSGPANLDTSGYLYRWARRSDQAWDTRYSANPSLSLQYDSAGDYTVTVEALSDKGERLTAARQVKITQGFSAPVPAFTFTPDSGNFKTPFTFDAAATRDAEEANSLLVFSWDFNNDQKFDTVVKGNPVAAYTFPEEGRHLVSLTVRDTSGLWARVSHTVTVNRLDTLIVPVWTVTPEYPSDLDTVRLNALQSYYTGDPGRLLTWSWKPYRGAWTPPSESPEYTWIRPLKGTYRFALRVYSAEGLYNEREFDVVVARANKPPTARITRNIRFGNILTTYEFDAWSSSDPESTPSELQARWDFESDGNWDTPFSEEKKISRVFTAPGAWRVTLEVMDPGGLRGTATTDVQVSRFTHPISVIRDVRDGQPYSIVQIGNRWWMGENLKWDMHQTGFGDYYPSWCFNNNPAICTVTGRLYYAATVAADYTGETEVRNLCPRGFHIPDIDDWLELIREAGAETAGTELAYGGKTDFNILLGGYAAYRHYGEFTEFTPDSLYKVAYLMVMPEGGTQRVVQYKRNDTRIQFLTTTSEGYYSVRCVKDR